MLDGVYTMEQRRPPEYIIEVFADPSSVKDVVRGIPTTPLSLDSEHVQPLTNITTIRYFAHDLLPSVLPFYTTEDS